MLAVSACRWTAGRWGQIWSAICPHPASERILYILLLAATGQYSALLTTHPQADGASNEPCVWLSRVTWGTMWLTTRPTGPARVSSSALVLLSALDCTGGATGPVFEAAQYSSVWQAHCSSCSITSARAPWIRRLVVSLGLAASTQATSRHPEWSGPSLSRAGLTSSTEVPSTKPFSLVVHLDYLFLAKMHTECSTSTQQEHRANRGKVHQRSKPTTEDPAQRTRTDTSPLAQKTIAVIGTTGFLGPYLLASLLQTHAGSNILCINRRADGERRTLVALEGIAGHGSSESSRVRFLVADITRQDVGMGPVQDELLASAVDEVVFNAWNPHWGLPLASFQPLLSAVASVIAFCRSSPRQPRITFVSSVCAVGDWPRQHPEQRLIPERVVWDLASAMRHGYGQSKCIAEQLLARAHAESGLRFAIIRPGQIGGPARSSTAHNIWPVQGWLFSIIEASARTGYWPAHLQLLNWIPVDALAEGVARVVCGEWRVKDVQVLNMLHPQPAPWRLLFATLQSRFGLRAEEVSLPEWLDALEPGALKLDTFLRAAGRGREYDMEVETGNASAVLPAVAPITEGQLMAWISGWDLKLGQRLAKI